MKTIYYLQPQDEPPQVENLIVWHYYFAGRRIYSPDLIVLTEQFYFPN